MSDKADTEELREAIDRGHFVRAAQIAESLGLPQQQVNDIRIKALWEMAAVNRNALGTKRLAQEYGFSKKELKEFLEEYVEKRRTDGDCKVLEPCYDITTGSYLNFEEWMYSLFKRYDKISVV